MFRVMSDMEITIAQISDLKMVHIYELTGLDVTKAGEGCSAIAVYYRESEKLNLNEYDPCFQDLFDKLLELYAATPNKEAISMDPVTREILEAGVGIMHDMGFAGFQKENGTLLPFFPYDSLLSKRFLPLAEYFLCAAYKVLDIDLMIIGREHGYRGASLLVASNKGEEKEYYVKIQKKDEKRTTIKITNFAKPGGLLTIEICMEWDSMSADYYSDDGEFEGKSIYLFGRDKMTEKHDMTFRDKKVFLEQAEKEMQKEQTNDYDKELFLIDVPVIGKYSLPWGIDYYSLWEQLGDSLDADVETCRLYGIYEYKEADFADIQSSIHIENETTNVKLSVNSVRVYRCRMQDGRMQSYFVPMENHSMGRYKKELAGKYFLQ